MTDPILPGAEPQSWPGGPAGALLKEPVSATHSVRSEILRLWEHLESPLFLIHVRKATWGAPRDENTQPFLRSHGRHDWLFAHGGSLRARHLEGVTMSDDARDPRRYGTARLNLQIGIPCALFSHRETSSETGECVLAFAPD